MSEHASTFFPAPADFRVWLDEHHATTEHLWVGYYKKATKKPSVTCRRTPLCGNRAGVVLREA